MRLCGAIERAMADLEAYALRGDGVIR